nr:group I intron-associated PD-(D/E)XK endonuclease [Halorubrum arcis]
MPDRSDRFESLEEPHKRGQAAEAIVKSEFVSRGIPVLTPTYDNEPYDIVVEVDDSFHRVQVKTAFEATTSGAVRFRTRSTRTKSSGTSERGTRTQSTSSPFTLPRATKRISFQSKRLVKRR